MEAGQPYHQIFSVWSDDELEKLRALLTDTGKTYRMIGKQLGRSEGAVDQIVGKLKLRRGMSPVMWPQERIDRMEELLALGYSRGQIAKELGLTRNSVIAKAHRMGISHQRGQGDDRTTVRVVKPRKPRAKRELASLPWQPAERPAPVITETPPQWLGISLLDLTNETCRYPSGDGPFTFCGDPTADFVGGQPYCACHSRIAYHRRAA